MKEYVATDMAELIRAIIEITRGQENSQLWWRGHADVKWPLVPSLYRRGFESKESNINARFMMKAKPRYPNCPSNSDAFSWLFLMQHYRLPTRLLDWSESPLVAMYFAIAADAGHGTDGALWALTPTGLNLHQLKREAICMPGSSELRKLARDAFLGNKEGPDRRILSVLTEQTDLRHMVQQSVFTIHGCATPINELPESSAYLAKIRIPVTVKPAFQQVLTLFGISRSGLFPDLENLAAELGSLDFVLRAAETDQTDRLRD
jgi:hypothetical protein